MVEILIRKKPRTKKVIRIFFYKDGEDYGTSREFLEHNLDDLIIYIDNYLNTHSEKITNLNEFFNCGIQMVIDNAEFLKLKYA